MYLIFGTTSKRKVEDLQNIINETNLDIQVVSMDDIGWDRGEIEEKGFNIIAIKKLHFIHILTTLKKNFMKNITIQMAQIKSKKD